MAARKQNKKSSKLSYSVGLGKIPLIGKTLGDYFDETVAIYPDNEAIVSYYQNVRFTYSQLKKKVDGDVSK